MQTPRTCRKYILVPSCCRTVSQTQRQQCIGTGLKTQCEFLWSIPPTAAGCFQLRHLSPPSVLSTVSLPEHHHLLHVPVVQGTRLNSQHPGCHSSRGEATDEWLSLASQQTILVGNLGMVLTSLVYFLALQRPWKYPKASEILRFVRKNQELEPWTWKFGLPLLPALSVSKVTGHWAFPFTSLV